MAAVTGAPLVTTARRNSLAALDASLTIIFPGEQSGGEV